MTLTTQDSLQEIVEEIQFVFNDYRFDEQRIVDQALKAEGVFIKRDQAQVIAQKMLEQQKKDLNQTYSLREIIAFAIEDFLTTKK